MMRVVFLVVVVTGAALTASAQQSTEAVPGGFYVTRVAPPFTPMAHDAVSYRVEPKDGVEVVSAVAGQLPAVDAAHGLMVVLRLPDAVAPGPLLAARVVFARSDGERVVDVVVQVSAQHRVIVRVTGEPPDVLAGEPVTIPFYLANVGNLREAVDVHLDAAPQWQVEPRTITVVLAPGQRVERMFRAFLPNRDAYGDFFFNLRAVTSDSAMHTAIRVRVVSGAARTSGVGPVLHLTGGASRVDQVVTGASAVSVVGNVTPSIAVRAEYAPTPPSTFGVARSLANVGLWARRPRIELSGSSWTLVGGAAWSDLTPLSGVNVSGDGAYFARRGRGVTGRLIVARAASYGNARGTPHDSIGLLAGAVLSVPAGMVGLTIAASRLEDPRTDRYLESYETGIASRDWRWVNFESAVARRRFQGGEGTGYRASVGQSFASGGFEMSYLQAPGGNSAFAPASTRVLGSARRRFGKHFSIIGDYTHTADTLVAGGSLMGESWSISPALVLSRALSMTAAYRSSRLDYSGMFNAFGNSQRGASLGVSLHGRVSFAVRGSYEQLGRTVSVDGGTAALIGNRVEADASSSISGAQGLLRIEGHYEQSASDLGMLPRMTRVSVIAERVRPSVLPHGAFIDAAISHLNWATSQMLTARVALGYEKGAYTIMAALERDPFTRVGDRVPMLYSLKVDRAFRLPMLAGGMRGIVYDDRNGNGMRDTGEEGIGDVTVVADGGESARTDPTGRYLLRRSVDGTVRLDPKAVPFGWIAGTPRNTRARDIPLVAITALDVELVVGSAEAARGLSVDGAVLFARDSVGREWRGRWTSGGHMRFDGLPVGTYTILLDASAMAEPMRLATDVPVVVLEKGKTVKVTLSVVGRPVRVFEFEGGKPRGPRNRNQQ